MDAMELLRAVAAASAQAGNPGDLPPNVVRFTLEYRGAVTPKAEQPRLEAAVGARLPSLFQLDADLPQFLVLQFDDVARTISPPSLFAIADDLAQALELGSCTPDVGVRGLEPATDDDIASESVVADPLMNLTCKTKNPKPTNPGWAAASVRANKVWGQSTGASILVAQPDTGVATHPSIQPGLDMTLAFNVLTNQPGAADPLKKGSGNPGHGTATSSVVMGRAGLQGIAPDAKVAPIRAVESVIVFDGAPIARAIMHAIRIKAHVITMSLGGLFISPALKEALSKAVAADIIVCAAAGNCVQPIVVYPASDKNVHAIGGIGDSDEPWRGSSRGRKVAFSAPAENVFVASRSPNDGGAGVIRPSEGTSFATAATAGVAALWLSHFGRDAVIAEARSRGISVQRLFLLAAVDTVRPPKKGPWDKRYGAGILDAEKLLALELAQIPGMLPMAESGEDPALDEQTRALIEVMALAAEPEMDQSFDWARFGPEAVYLAGDAWRRSQAEQAVFVESALKPEPSDGLRAAGLPTALSTVLAAAGAEPAVQPPLPRGIGGPAAGPTVLTSADRADDGVILTESTRSKIRGVSSQAVLDAAEAHLGRRVDEGDTDSDTRGWALEHAGRALSRLSASDGPLPFAEAMVLEALVRLTGRPAFPVRDGAIKVDPNLDPEWFGALQIFEVARFAASVGRVDISGQHMGTGSVVAPGVILTNRHVLEAIAEEIAGPAGSRWVFSRGEASIDFSDVADGSKRFILKSVIDAAPTPTSGRVKFSTLDAVLLEVETQNGANLALPPQLDLADASDVSIGRNEVVTIGYPARPSTASMRDPVTGDFRPDVMERLQQIFGLRYGRKYLAPGAIDLTRGAPAGDIEKWVFAHDATTLGGNSGSPVAALAELAVHGLHFAGATLVDNYAHSLSAVRRSNRLPKLDGIGANWV